MVCDSCNQYFGVKVENPALSSFPFLPMRTFMSVPTKKGRMPSLPTAGDDLRAAGVPGSFTVNVGDRLYSRYKASQTCLSIILAKVTEPLALCRLLLKAGLEMLAKHAYDVATSDRMKAARTFARYPKRGTKWWFGLHCDPELLTDAMQWPGKYPSELRLFDTYGGLDARLWLNGLSAIVPLEPEIPPLPELSEDNPILQLVWATC